MAKQPIFVLRQSPDWHSLSADFKKGLPIDPARFRPPEHIPGFPGNIVQLVRMWNEQMGVDFFSCRSRLKEMCEDSIAQIPAARRISYREVDSLGSELEDSILFYHDDDDWFAPDLLDTLSEVLPEDFDVCVFPLVRLSAQTSTLIRQVGKPAVLIGEPRPFSHRYQSNNYGINGKLGSEAIVGMKDHVNGSEYANTHGLRDVYIDRILSATAKTPCSAQAMVHNFRNPAKAMDHIRGYVEGLQTVEIPADMPWIGDRLANVIALFSEAVKMPAPSRPKAQPAKAAAPAGAAKPAAAGPAAVAQPGARSQQPQRHQGIQFLEFMKFLGKQIAPSSYFEVGTRMGNSLAQIDCDAVCVDPAFAISANVIKKRKRSFFFQMTADDFFAAHDVKQFFPNGIDLAFLHGVHNFEFLLRDFMNAEKSCRQDSVILLLDCLPFSKNITNRVKSPGAWAGDVWKVLPILKKYRPDLKAVMFDCPPTGLIALTNLDPTSTVLSEVYDSVVAEYIDVVELPEDLHSMYPRGDSKSLRANPQTLGDVFPIPGAKPVVAG